jgi:poly(A) polymerase
LPADVSLAEQVAARFRLSSAQKKRLARAAARGSEAGNAYALAYRLGREQALDRLLIAGADAAPLKDWEIPLFPLKGGQIVDRGVKAGPEVARILQTVEALWIEEGFPPEERVLALLEETLAA